MKRERERERSNRWMLDVRNNTRSIHTKTSGNVRNRFSVVIPVFIHLNLSDHSLFLLPRLFSLSLSFWLGVHYYYYIASFYCLLTLLPYSLDPLVLAT